MKFAIQVQVKLLNGCKKPCTPSSNVVVVNYKLKMKQRKDAVMPQIINTKRGMVMKAKGLILGLGMMMGVAILSTGSQVLAADDEWSDYDPCGWSAEQEVAVPEIAEVEWTDYDPCGWNDEQEAMAQEVAEVEWSDYDPCGWNDEQEVMAQEVAEVEWSDYDPCGLNVEQEADAQEVVVAEIEWSDYDPCGWNDEQESMVHEVAAVVVKNHGIDNI